MSRPEHVFDEKEGVVCGGPNIAQKQPCCHCPEENLKKVWSEVYSIKTPLLSWWKPNGANEAMMTAGVRRL